MAKQKLWDIQVLEDNELLFTPGEFPAEAFVDQCVMHDDGYKVEVEDVAYCYARWIPLWESGEYQGRYLDYPVKQKRGAFLMTYAIKFYSLVEHPDH